MESVLRSTLDDMTEAQKQFICYEMGFSADELDNASEERLGEVYDVLCDIEIEETIDDDELSERGKLAESLVTLMGNAIAESEGYLNEYDEG